MVIYSSIFLYTIILYFTVYNKFKQIYFLEEEKIH